MQQISSEAGIDITDRVVGAYLGLAVGDALGATVEFLTPGEIIHQYRIHKDAYAWQDRIL